VRELEHRIVLTENCNASCKHCFNAESRDGNVMDYNLFLQFMEHHSEFLNNFSLKIMGGEPTVHPKFIELTAKACEYYPLVMVFTNGLKLNEILRHPDLMKYHFEGRLGYVVNGFTFDLDKFDEYKNYADVINLHFVFTRNGSDEIVDKAIESLKYNSKVHIKYSADTQVNLFDRKEMIEYRKIWMGAVLKLIPVLMEKQASYSFDRQLPICFFTQKMIETLEAHHITNINIAGTCCNCVPLGLIDYNFDLYFCNQTRIKLGSVINQDGTFKSMDEIRDMIKVGPSKKVTGIKKLSNKCKRCVSLATCKVGCYYNTLQREYINENSTNFKDRREKN